MLRIFMLTLFTCLISHCQAQPISYAMTYIEYRESQQKINIEGHSIAYLDKGVGPTILLLHGVPTSGWLYRGIAQSLVDSGFRVIVPDMLGFGNSDNPDGYEIYDKTAHAKRILALMDSLNIETWVHATHDAGGLWTWELLKIAPERVSRLVLFNTIIYKEGFSPPGKLKQGGKAKFVIWAYRKLTGLVMGPFFKGALVKKKLSKDEKKGYKTPLKEGKTKALYKFFTTNTVSIPDYSELLKSLDIPTLVIWGEKDKFLHWAPQAETVMADLRIEAKNVHALPYSHLLQEEIGDDIVKWMVDFCR
jgi:pimeloyl-ACP methyl ester carboxylesterase